MRVKSTVLNADSVHLGPYIRTAVKFGAADVSVQPLGATDIKRTASMGIEGTLMHPHVGIHAPSTGVPCKPVARLLTLKYFNTNIIIFTKNIFAENLL